MNGYNFTDRVRKVLQLAREEAHRLGHEYVGTEHILLAIIREGEGVALEAARSEVGRMLRTEMPEVSATTPPVTPPVPYTPDARGSLQLALQEARDLKAASLGPELLLLGVLRVMLTAPAGSAGAALATLLNAAGLTPERVREVIARGDQA